MLAAREAIARGYDDIVVTYADTPLIRGATLARLRARARREERRSSALGFEPADPTGYGRLIERDGRLVAIREHKDASATEERASRLCNAGPIGLRGRARRSSLLDAVRPRQRPERILPDRPRRASPRRAACGAARWRPRRRGHGRQRSRPARRSRGGDAGPPARARDDGGRDAGRARDGVPVAATPGSAGTSLIEPNVVFGPGVVVEDGAVIHAFTHLEGARVAGGASVGPYARLRPGADIGARRAGRQFRRDQEGDVRAGAKANHLSYIGDARVGAGANIGAGTIICNYDGFVKSRTDDRRRRLHRLQLRAGRAGQDRRRRLYRLGLGDHQGRRAGRAGRGARPAGVQARLGEGVPGAQQEVVTPRWPNARGSAPERFTAVLPSWVMSFQTVRPQVPAARR